MPDVRAVQETIQLQAGSPATITVAAVDTDGAPVDVTGLSFVVALNPTGTITATTSDPETGTRTFTLTGEDTAALQTGGGLYSIANGGAEWIVGRVRASTEGTRAQDHSVNVTVGSAEFAVTVAAYIGGEGGAVDSVNGQTGAVVLDASDVGAVASTDPRLTDSRTPTGGAGGVLSGSFPNPGFAVDMVEQTELASALAGKENAGIAASLVADRAKIVTGTTAPVDTTAYWARTADNVEGFVDYRPLPDGPAPEETTVGGMEIHDISETAPPDFYAPLTVVDGAVRTADLSGKGVGAAYAIGARTGPFRVTVGLADFTRQAGDPAENSSNITITDVNGNGPILHIGYMVDDGAGGWLTQIQGGWDIDYSPTLFDPVTIPGLVGAGDRLGLGFNGTHWTAYLNGEPVTGIDPWPHDSELVAIADLAVSSNPLGGLDGKWLAGTHWWALTDGDTDHEPDDLGLHRHDGDGWVKVEELSDGEVAAIARTVAGGPSVYRIVNLGAAFSATPGVIDTTTDIGMGTNVVFGADIRDNTGTVLPPEVVNAEPGDLALIVSDPFEAGFPLGLYRVAEPAWELIEPQVGDYAVMADTSGSRQAAGVQLVYEGEGNGTWGGWSYAMWGVMRNAVSQFAAVATVFGVFDETGEVMIPVDLASYDDGVNFVGTIVATLDPESIGGDDYTITLPSAESYYGRTVTILKVEAENTVTIAAQPGDTITGTTALTGTAKAVHQYRAVTASEWLEISNNVGGSGGDVVTSVDGGTGDIDLSGVYAPISAAVVRPKIVDSGENYNTGGAYGTPAFDGGDSSYTAVVAAGRTMMAWGDLVTDADLTHLLFEVTATSLTAGQSVNVVCYNANAKRLPTTLAWAKTIEVGTATGTPAGTSIGASSGFRLPASGYFVGIHNPSTNAGSVTMRALRPRKGPYGALGAATIHYRGVEDNAGATPSPTLAGFNLSLAPNIASRLGLAESVPVVLFR